MALTLSRLCDDCQQKYNMRLLAGKNGLENTVRWVHTVEDREVPEFLHGGELVFTTGIGHLNNGGGDGRLLAFTKHLNENNAAGLVVNIGPYISEVPQPVIDYCNENDFPCFSLPWKIKIIDITYDLCAKIIKNENAEVSIAESFSHIIKAGAADDDNTGVFEKAGFNEFADTRIIALSFFQQGADVTERIEANNRGRLWKILVNSENGGASFMYDGRIITILQHCGDQKVESIIGMLGKSISPNVEYCIGVSSEKTGIRPLNALYKEAVTAERTAKYEKKQVGFYSGIGVDKIIAEVSDANVRNDFVAETIGKLIEYDKNFKTQYLELLKLYLQNDCSVMNVSEKIRVHRNTVNYQIRQIKKILNTELDEKQKMSILLAIRMLELDSVN